MTRADTAIVCSLPLAIRLLVIRFSPVPVLMQWYTPLHMEGTEH